MSTQPTAVGHVESALKVAEVARHLDVDPSLVYSMISSGQLRAVRVGRLIRIPESALADFLAGRIATVVAP